MNNLFAENVQRKLIIIFLLSVSIGYSFAQPTSQEKKDDIDAQRIGFITKELQLTPQEAQEFWPVYNKYRAEVEVLRKSRATELMSARINLNDYTDEQLNKVIENEFNFRQKELDLSRRYNEEYKKILTFKKVASLYRAEQLFKISLIKDMRQEKTDKNLTPGIKN